jgi:hypothetical protein
MREVIIAKLQRRRASLSEGESQALLSMLLFLFELNCMRRLKLLSAKQLEQPFVDALSACVIACGLSTWRRSAT